jgi:hypothetical protein
MNALIQSILGRFFANGEEKRRRQSHTHPVVRVHVRDDFRYYEKGRSVIVGGELMSGSTGTDRVIYRDCEMKWEDTGEQLTAEERERALQQVGKHLDSKNVRWEFR